jgi:hypothetical protein
MTLSFGQDGVRGCGSTHYSMDYKPTIVKSLFDLPTNIQDSIKNHLLKKLGYEFYELLTFESCLIIDYQDLVRQDPKVLNYKWQVPKYDLGFYVIKREAGINYYCSRMSLDSNGLVIDSIDFPSYKINPQSSTFADLTQIKKASKKLGFNPDNYILDFVDDHIVLKFTRTKIYKYIEYLEISAHTAQKIRQFKVTGIIDWF